MGVFLKLLAVLKVALPFPDFSDRAAVLAWWTGLGEPAADLIKAIRDQFNTTGRVTLDFPGDVTIVLADSGRCLAVDPAVMEVQLAAVPPEAWGDGKWLEIFKMLLPILIQILPFFLTPAPTPEPSPDPAPTPDVV